jgi:O-acetyl-ADP-ribose deacetylase (regulator of RNase III)
MMKVVIGDILYPKSEAMIIPANTKGVMSRGVASRVVKSGLSGIFKEVKEYITNNTVEVEDCFSTGPGRLNRRKVKRIYHSVIKRLQSDFSSIHIINKALNNALQTVVDDGYQSVAVCGLGIEDGNLDAKTIARITVEVCNRYDNRIEISIIDDNKEFIREVNSFIKEFNDVNTE